MTLTPTPTPTPITPDELSDLIGELDPDTTARVLALGPTFDEVAEALSAIEDELAYGEMRPAASSARAVELRAILEEVVLDQGQAFDGHEYAVPI